MTYMNWRMDDTIKVGRDVKIGKGAKIGKYVVIEEGCVIGDDVKIGNFVYLGPGTILKDKVWMDTQTISSGQCVVGERTQIRYQSIIARNVEIGEDVFFCAGVKTAYLDHTGNPTKEPLRIGDKCFLGDNATVLAGLDIADGIVIGAHSLVVKNCLTRNGVYVGCPAVLRRLLLPNEIKNRDERIARL